MIENKDMKNKSENIEILTFERWAGNSDKTINIGFHPIAKVYPFHSHNFYEINYVIKGTCTNTINNQELKLKKGDMVILHPWTPHTIFNDANSLVMNITIRYSYFINKFSHFSTSSPAFKKFLTTAGTDSYYSYLRCDGNCIYDIITEIINEKNSNLPNKTASIESLVTLMIIKLLRSDTECHLSRRNNTSPIKMAEIMQYVYDNYKTVTLKGLAEHFHYSETYISKMFVTEQNESFVDILTKIRLQHAINYLAESADTVESVAYRIGYNSNTYFQRRFKAITGITPNDFRKNASKYGTPYILEMQNVITKKQN